MMKLGDYVNLENLRQLIADGYINERRHPRLPLRILNYSNACQFDQKWPHEVCACRGLIIDDQDNIVARPQYKFFNLGQTSTVMFEWHEDHGYARSVGFRVDENVMVDAEFITRMAQESKQPLTITRKMDGWAGILYEYNGQWGISSRGSFDSPGALFATEKWQKFVKYEAVEFIPNGWTLFFEIISKELRIVIPYEWEGLCLLTAVNNETGEEMSYEQLHELWVNLNSYSKTLDASGNSIPGKPWCRLVEKFDIDLETAKNDKSMEEEGYVASVSRLFMPPVKAKIKLAEYLRLHKILCNVTPQMIWGAMAYPTDQWLGVDSWMDRKTKEVQHTLPVPSEFAQWTRQWQRGLMNAFHKYLVESIEAQSALLARETMPYNPFNNDMERKKWLTNDRNYSRSIAEAAMNLRSGRIVEAYEILWKLVRPHGKDERFYAEGKGE